MCGVCECGVCVCLYVSLSTYIYQYIRVCIYIYIVYVHTYIYTYIYIYVHVRIYLYMYVYICTSVCVSGFVRVFCLSSFVFLARQCPSRGLHPNFCHAHVFCFLHPSGSSSFFFALTFQLVLFVLFCAPSCVFVLAFFHGSKRH